MEAQSKFGEKLSELMFSENLTNEQMGKIAGTDASSVSRWRQGKHNIKLSKAIIIADHFKCSLDFLFGRSETQLDFLINPALPFNERLHAIMQDRGITRYRIVTDLKKSHGNFDYWKTGCDPFIDTVIELAIYFDISLDQFVGRDR